MCAESEEPALGWGQLSPLLGLSALGELHVLSYSEAAWERAGALSGKGEKGAGLSRWARPVLSFSSDPRLEPQSISTLL